MHQRQLNKSQTVQCRAGKTKIKHHFRERALLCIFVRRIIVGSQLQTELCKETLSYHKKVYKSYAVYSRWERHEQISILIL
jgi:hypothetical protein